ncbi:hypothetical protein AACH06_11535 [Ideonella sp. DXS29W]|uniref:DUF664 domain-containing protein n=1 Tax=Ideonella lacteola TaxID=2984193 RepID=A0ABU9BNA9_9BURK
MVEPTQPGWFHTVTIDDAWQVLAHLPAADLSTFELIVMRQSTRKQRILNPAWGRAAFYFDVEEFNGRAIVLEAQNLEPIIWPVSLTPERARELDRLVEDGHAIHRGKRWYEIRSTQASLRNTVLYRTLLHEVGHHVDHRRCSDEEWDSLTAMEKEDYAHRYAAENAALLKWAGLIPFAPMVDAEALRSEGLDPSWFATQ